MASSPLLLLPLLLLLLPPEVPAATRWSSLEALPEGAAPCQVASAAQRAGQLGPAPRAGAGRSSPPTALHLDGDHRGPERILPGGRGWRPAPQPHPSIQHFGHTFFSLSLSYLESESLSCPPPHPPATPSSPLGALSTSCVHLERESESPLLGQGKEAQTS